MKKAMLCVFPLLVALASPGAPAGADDNLSRAGRNAAHRFATLPDGVRLPEGITANPQTREIYVSTFDFENTNKLLRFGHNGRLLAQRDFGATPLLGLAFRGGRIYIANFGASKIQRISATFNASTPIEDVAVVPGIGAPGNRTVDNPDGSSDIVIFGSSGFPAPNALAFDADGNLYVSDSFQGAVFRIDSAETCAPACVVTTLAHDPLLATAGFPPFGANGLALDRAESVLFVANTGDDRVLKLELATGTLSVFAESVNGADGIAFDRHGRLWVAANQNDEVVALNENGRVIARVGDFHGIRRDGSPEGLLFPASLVIVGDDMFVTNLALTLTPAAGDEPEEDVSRYTVSRIRLPPSH
jgi:DNA-binding beta-propeller fold protein YncE